MLISLQHKPVYTGYLYIADTNINNNSVIWNQVWNLVLLLSIISEIAGSYDHEFFTNCLDQYGDTGSERNLT